MKEVQVASTTQEIVRTDCLQKHSVKRKITLSNLLQWE